MELHFLEEIGNNLTEEQAQQPQNFRTRGEILLVSEPTRLSLPNPDEQERPLGVTLYNEGDVSVYSYLFYFDPNDLTISEHLVLIPSQWPPIDCVCLGPWYLPPTGAGTGKVDPPLKAHSMFCIGYGNGAASPWSFHFMDGRTKDVGVLQTFSFNLTHQLRIPYPRNLTLRPESRGTPILTLILPWSPLYVRPGSALQIGNG
jgi:hypothetical protein